MTREEEKNKARFEYVSKRLANPDFPTYNAEYELEAAFDEGIEWTDSHPHWISVEDELPKETNMYIVVQRNVVCTMTWYDNLKEWADIYVDENECVQSRQMDGITHWMALPLPPAKLSSVERNGKNEL